jgi:hypothetical protein
MSKQTTTFNALDTPQRIWAAVSDFGLWDAYLGVPDPQPKGWGNRFKSDGPAGQGGRLQMLFGDKLMQEWSIDEWAPPSRLRLSSVAWHGSPYLRMDSVIEVSIAPVNPTETRVELSIETFFSHPFVGPLMFFIPLGGDLRACLRKMERGILERLSGAR